MKEADWEIASHGLKWIDYRDYAEDDERAHMAEAIRIHTAVTGARPLGWYTGPLLDQLDPRSRRRRAASSIRPTPMPTTCPTGSTGPRGPFLIIPYTLDANDMRFATPQGFNSGDQFFAYLKDCFDTLYAEGEAGRAEDDVGRPPLPPRRTAGPGRGARPLRRLRRRARTRSGCRAGSTSPGTGTPITSRDRVGAITRSAARPIPSKAG